MKLKKKKVENNFYLHFAGFSLRSAFTSIFIFFSQFLIFSHQARSACISCPTNLNSFISQTMNLNPKILAALFLLGGLCVIIGIVFVYHGTHKSVDEVIIISNQHPQKTPNDPLSTVTVRF